MGAKTAKPANPSSADKRTATEPVWAKPEHPSVSEVIENLGLGPAQLRTCLTGGAVWIADGAELLLISSVTMSVATEWGLSGFERGLIVSLVFVGVFFGNLLSGPLGDTYGRRLPILVSLMMVFVFSFLSASAWGFVSLAILRFFVGISFGIGQPAYQTLVSETTPSHGRIVMTGIGNCMMPVGEMYSALLILCNDPQMIHLDWRWLLRMGAIPSAVFGLLAFMFMKESSLFLACCGRHDETRIVLESMRSDNSRPDCAVQFKPHRALAGDVSAQEVIERQLGIVFGRRFLLTTVIVIYSTFVLNFTYFGCLYAFPQILSESLGGSPAMNLFIGAIWEMFGYIFGIFCSIRLARKPVMRLYLGLIIISLACFTYASSVAQRRWPTQLLLYVGYYGIKFFPGVGFNVIYTYASEVYPTVARTSGTAIALAGGRVASTVAPMVYEGVVSLAEGRYTVYFLLILCMCLVNLLLVQALPYETAGALLEDGDELEEPAETLVASGSASSSYGGTAAA
mmetsp:Transcript_616/g.1514  ORF Transcript_616/g.1514 Transcript_616/m.1514 type:complete len:512 (+) Transcript_616:119-1654(+)